MLCSLLLVFNVYLFIFLPNWALNEISTILLSGAMLLEHDLNLPQFQADSDSGRDHLKIPFISHSYELASCVPMASSIFISACCAAHSALFDLILNCSDVQL